jgi:mono/diheme cytochrome c family protein
MRKSRIVLFCVGLLAAAAVALFFYVRSRGFSARERPNALEMYLARQLRYLATTPESRNLKNPLQPTELGIAEARDHFADHCAVCHANDGSGRTLVGKNMYPPAPDMRSEETQRLTDGEIFSIIQNGIRFTGMPGFGGEDEENWKLVLFIRHVPKLSTIELQLMQEINNLELESDGAAHAEPGRETRRAEETQ